MAEEGAGVERWSLSSGPGDARQRRGVANQSEPEMAGADRAFKARNSVFSLLVTGPSSSSDSTDGGRAAYKLAPAPSRRHAGLRSTMRHQLHRIQSVYDDDDDISVRVEDGDEAEEDDSEFLKKVAQKKMPFERGKIQVRLEGLLAQHGNDWGKVLIYITKEESFSKSEGEVKIYVKSILRRHIIPNPASASEQGSWDTPLHFIARRNMATVAQLLVEGGAPFMAKNAKKKMPVEVALEKGNDIVSSLIMDAMPAHRVRSLFLCSGRKECRFSFHKLISDKTMKTSLTMALDKMAEPQPRKPNLVRFYYKVLDGDENGRVPGDAGFDPHARSSLQLIAKIGNKTAVYHDVVRMLLLYKWKKFVSRKFYLQTLFFFSFVVIITFSLIIGGTAKDPMKYDRPEDKARGVFEVMSLLYLVWSLAAELNQLHKHGWDYWEDLYNYLDLGSIVLLITVLPLRLSETSAQWTVASIGYLLLCIKFFKYTCAFRNIGAYTQILGRIMRQDIVRFMIIFSIFLCMFAGSFFLALRGEEHFNTTLNKTQTDLDLFYHHGSYGRILFEGLRIMIHGTPTTEYYGETLRLGWLGIFIIIVFIFVIVVVLLNILIAQLSDTYQNVQSDAQRELELNRAYVVAHIEKNSLIFRDLRTKHFLEHEDVQDPIQKLRRWESPPLNDVHKQLNHLDEQLDHHESVLITLEHQMTAVTARLDALLEKFEVTFHKEGRLNEDEAEGEGAGADGEDEDGNDTPTRTPDDVRLHFVDEPHSRPDSHQSVAMQLVAQTIPLSTLGTQSPDPSQHSNTYV